MKHYPNVLLSIVAAGAGTISTVSAQSPPPYFTYTEGNLILGFQATSGQGASQSVFFNLGPATNFRDNGNQSVLGTIGTVLGATYGSNWYAREDVWFGVIANLNHHPTSGIGSRAAVSGDPSRTFYTSIPASAPGTGPLAPAGTYPSAALGLAGNTLRGMEQMLRPANGDGTGWNTSSLVFAERGIFREADNSGVLSLTIPQHATAWNNGWVQWNPNPGAELPLVPPLPDVKVPVPGPAVRVFTGGIKNTAGIQQNFGKGGSATYVDVQRILATNTGAAPTGVVGGGTYETTISISPSGVITSLTSSSSSAFTSWMDGFTAQLPDPADRLEAEDPDNDGIENVLEFVLRGNPAASSTNVLPQLNAAGTDFVFSFTRRADSAGEVAQVFEYSVDLSDWTTNVPVTIPTAPGTSGFATVGVSTGTAPNLVQAVTVTIPKGANTKLFGRLRAVK